MTNHSDRTYHRPGGFTLVELLVSIALVVILILGINMVFTSAGKTVGTGLAVSEANRAFRSAYTTIRNDIEPGSAGVLGMLPLNATSANRTPGLVIIAQQLVNQPVDASGNVATCDLGTLAYFAQGSFRRQTGSNPNEFFASMAPLPSAFIWYGHLWLPDSAGSFPSAALPPTFPGVPPAVNNPNNYYARDWRLGRMVVGVQAPDVNGHLMDYLGAQQLYVYRGGGLTMAPFSVGSNTTTDGVTVGSPFIQWSQCDLAGVDLFGVYRSGLDAYAAANPNTWGYGGFGYRFRANPFPARPLVPAAAAQTLPIFLNGCMSFRVDFAGDMDNDGNIDLTHDTPASGIQWYGYPNGLPRTDPKCVNTVQSILMLGTPPAYEHPFTDAYGNQAYSWAWSQYEMKPVALGGLALKGPSLIRLTVTLTDSNGRLPNGMTQEFIFEVPQK